MLWSGGAGGTERFVRDSALYGDMARFEHSVCFLSHGGLFATEMEKHGIQTYYLGMKDGSSISRGARVRGLMKQVAPHIIQSHCRNYLVNALIVQRTGPKKIYFEHGSDLVAQDQKKEVVFYNTIGHHYDLIVANSYYTRDKILDLTCVSADKISVFYIGIDPEDYVNVSRGDELRQTFGFSEEDTIIGTVGRLVEQKGIDDFIIAAAEIQKLCPACRFAVVGEGKKRTQLERMAHIHNVDIAFLGERPDIAAILTMFDLFLFTPKWEPFGIVVLEAMAASIPVVTYAVPGMQEIIDKGGGVVVEQRNPRLLAQTATDLLNNRTQYQRLQEEGRANVRTNFDIRKNMRELESIYRRLLSEK